MKKIFLYSLFFLLFTGCSITSATPKSAVEDLLKKYQMKDDEVISQLDDVINNNISYTESQKKQYKTVLERQYSDMTYDIKDDTIDGNNSVVSVEVEVYDYSSVVLDGIYKDQDEYMSSLFDAMGDTKERIKYTIDFNVKKDGDKWVVENISDVDRKKIHGLY